jgi:hypothetical protein
LIKVKVATKEMVVPLYYVPLVRVRIKWQPEMYIAVLLSALSGGHKFHHTCINFHLTFINFTLFYNLWYLKVQQMATGISAYIRHH